MRFVVALALFTTLVTPAAAAEWGIGAAAGTRPALSMAMSPTPELGYHVTSHLSDERVVITGDMQRKVRPAFGYGNGWRLAFYGGFGAEGLSERRGEGQEEYRLRLPVGAQCDILATAAQVFAEVAAAVGPLPATRLSGAMQAGLRAVF